MKIYIYIHTLTPIYVYILYKKYIILINNITFNMPVLSLTSTSFPKRSLLLAFKYFSQYIYNIYLTKYFTF